MCCKADLMDKDKCLISSEQKANASRRNPMFQKDDFFA